MKESSGENLEEKGGVFSIQLNGARSRKEKIDCPGKDCMPQEKAGGNAWCHTLAD